MSSSPGSTSICSGSARRDDRERDAAGSERRHRKVVPMKLGCRLAGCLPQLRGRASDLTQHDEELRIA
jgi:hypothetical protein